MGPCLLAVQHGNLLFVTSIPEGENQKATILGDRWSEVPFRKIGSLVDQLVCILTGSGSVVVDLLIRRRLLVFGACRGLRVAAVVEAGSIGHPRQLGEFQPFELLAEELAGLQIHDSSRSPVGAAILNGVGEEPSIRARIVGGERHGRVCRPGVGIDEELRSCIKSLLCV